MSAISVKSLKKCTKCGSEKSLDLFPSNGKERLHSWCKSCKYSDRSNYGRAKEYNRHGREYYSRNKDKWREIKARRRAAKLQATPPWVDSEYLWMISEVYSLAPLREECTGVKWEVDHIVPLQGKYVCGLHVPWNLQVITQKENRMKGNKYEVI